MDLKPSSKIIINVPFYGNSSNDNKIDSSKYDFSKYNYENPDVSDYGQFQDYANINNTPFEDKKVNYTANSHSSSVHGVGGFFENYDGDFEGIKYVNSSNSEISLSEQNTIMPKLETASFKEVYDYFKNHIYDFDHLNESDYDTYLDQLNFFQKVSSHIRQKKYGIDNVFIYYSLLDKMYGDSIDLNSKYFLSKAMARIDKSNNYYLAHKFPVVKNGSKFYPYILPTENGAKDHLIYNGLYAQYFNEYGIEVTCPYFDCSDSGIVYLNPTNPDSGYDAVHCTVCSKYYNLIMNEMMKYSRKYRKTILCGLKKLHLVRGGYLGVAPNKGEVSINISSLFNENENHQNMIDTFHHEFGHSFAANFSHINYTDTEEWKTIYKQILDDSLNPSVPNLLLPCRKDDGECFAEVMAEYFNYNSTGESIHNPNDLKMIKIDYNGYDNLYDFIDSLVGGCNLGVASYNIDDVIRSSFVG